MADTARRDREAWLDVLHREHGLAVGDLHHRAAFAVVRVRHDLRDVVDGSRRGLVPFERLDDLVEGVPGGPSFDGGVELVDVFDAPRVRHEPGVVDQLGALDRSEDALRDPLRGAGDAHPSAVARRIGAAWRGVRDAVADTAGDDAKPLVQGRERAGDLEEGFDQGEVDDLARRVPRVARVEGDHHGERSQ